MQTNRSILRACVGGTTLIIFGLLSTASLIFRLLNLTLLWSLVVILMGGLFFIAMFTTGKDTPALAIPGAIVSGVGLVMLIQSLTRQWNVMPYLWIVIILFLGTGIYIMGWRSADTKQKNLGLRMIKISSTLFIVFGIVCEFTFTNFSYFLFPILLFGAGAFLILSRSGWLNWKKSRSNKPLSPTNDLSS